MCPRNLFKDIFFTRSISIILSLHHTVNLKLYGDDVAFHNAGVDSAIQRTNSNRKFADMELRPSRRIPTGQKSKGVICSEKMAVNALALVLKPLLHPSVQARDVVGRCI